MSDDFITYKQFHPHVELREYIQQYWYAKVGEHTVSPFSIVPDGVFDLLIFFKDGEIIDTMLTGIWDKVINVDISNSEVLGVCFKPIALYGFDKISVKNLVNDASTIDFKEWGFNKQQFTDIWNESYLNIIHFLDRYFLSFFSLSEHDQRLGYLFNQIDRSLGMTKIQTLSESIGWSTRHIHRKVNNLIGIGAKEYAQIVRFKRVLNLTQKDKSNYVGYFDQAHFIKTFKNYMGFTPQEVDLSSDVRFIQYYSFNKD